MTDTMSRASVLAWGPPTSRRYPTTRDPTAGRMHRLRRWASGWDTQAPAAPMRPGIVVVATIAACQAGCFLSSSNFTTARTLPVGETTHTITGTMVGDRSGDCREDGFSHACIEPAEYETDAMLVPVPGYEYRAGIADRWELGLKSRFLGDVGIDCKWGLLRSRYFDVALMPTVRVNALALGSESSSDDEYSTDLQPGAAMDMGIIADINFSRSVSLVPHGVVAESVGSWNTSATTDATFSYGGGVGLNWRMSPRMSLQPDIAFLRVPGTDTPGSDGLAATFLFVGVGVVVGPTPEF